MLAEDLLQKYSPYPGPVHPGGGGLHRVGVLPVRHRRDQGARRQVGPVPRRAAGRRAGRRRTRRPGALRPEEDAGIIRMHFSGCSASCAQPQIADIGFRGEVAHVGNHLAEAVDIGMGGSLGADSGFIDWIEHARPVNDVPDALLRVVRRYQSERREDEPFYNWARRTPNDDLRQHAGRRGHRHAGHPRDHQAGGAGRMKAYRIRDEMNGIAEPPGKTWFWELQAGVIDAGRCIQCGTCVAACPSNSIGIDEDTDLPELVKMCTGCSLCWDFCPRGGLRYEALWPPSTMAATSPTSEDPAGGAVVRADAADNYWKITGGPPGDGLGAVLDAYSVRAGARPDEAQDGGVVTALLIAALAGGEIDGALVTRPSDDPDEPWKGVAHLATTAKEITEAAGSYYNQTMALAELDLSRYDLPAKPRIAVVGHPVRDPGHPGHAVEAVADRRPPDRLGGPDHRPAVHQELRLPGPDAAAAPGRPGHRHRAGEQGRRDPGPDDRRVPRRGAGRGRAHQELPRRRPQGMRRVRRLPGSERRPLGGQRRGHGRVEQRAGAHASGAGGPSTTPGAGSTSASSTIPRPWSSWTPSTSGSPSTACAARSTPTPRCSSTTPST